MSTGGALSTGGAMIEEAPARLIWGELEEHMLTAALPFRVTLTAVGEDKEPLPDYCGQLTISALTAKVCLAEGFEGRRLGLWCAPTPFFWPACVAHMVTRRLSRATRRVPNVLPGHYEHGFDSTICAPGSNYSLFLKGGNDSNFGMTLRLPSPMAAESDPDGTPAALPEDAETEDPHAFDGNFRPDSVTFYVRDAPLPPPSQPSPPALSLAAGTAYRRVDTGGERGGGPPKLRRALAPDRSRLTAPRPRAPVPPPADSRALGLGWAWAARLAAGAHR